MPIYDKDFQALQGGVNDMIQAAEARKSQQLKDMLDAKRLQENLTQAQEFAKAQGMKPGKYAVQASASGLVIALQQAKVPV